MLVWIYVAQNRFKWLTSLNTLIKLRTFEREFRY